MSRLIRYGKLPCPCCRKLISTNGLAFNSHMRAHVRKGEAVQTLSAAGLYQYAPLEKKCAHKMPDGSTAFREKGFCHSYGECCICGAVD